MFLPESDVLILYIPHEIPSRNQLRNFQRNVLSISEALNYEKVAINLSKVKYISTKNLRTLIDLKSHIESKGGEIVFYNLGPLVIKLLLKSGLYRFLNVVNNKEKLQNYFSQILSA